MLIRSYGFNRKLTEAEKQGKVWETFFFIFHPRSGLKELLWVILLTPGYAFILTYRMDWGMFYMALLSSYSLLGEPIPEITPYLTDKDFHLLSH